MSCDNIPSNIPMGFHNEKVIKMAILRKGDRIMIENASRSGKQAFIEALREIFSRPENNPSKAFERFNDTVEQAKKAIEEYTPYDPPEYNQTKYIKSKANAKPLFNGKSIKLARNNIKQKQKW